MKKKIFLSSKGYTLVEMLAVIIVFSILGGIITAIFTSSLRGSNKANITNEVRQNGNYALSQMAKMITYAKSFDGISKDGINYLGDCYIEPGSEEELTAEYYYLKFSSFDDNQTTFICIGEDTGGDNQQISSNSASLVDTEIVNIDNCTIYCTQPSLAQAPTLKINFALSQKSQSKFFEHKANISFETTVFLRNTSR